MPACYQTTIPSNIKIYGAWPTLVLVVLRTQRGSKATYFGMITKKRNAEKSNAFGSEHGVFRAGRKEYRAGTAKFFVLGCNDHFSHFMVTKMIFEASTLYIVYNLYIAIVTVLRSAISPAKTMSNCQYRRFESLAYDKRI